MYYPAFLDIRGKLCVVVGGGAVAARKAKALVKAGARVRVIAREITPALEGLRGVQCRRGRYTERDLNGCWLAIAATDDAQTQRAVWRDACRRGILCNSADSAERSNFLVPAAFHRGDLQVAISTGGTAPAVARRLRRELQKIFGAEYGRLLSLLRELRPRLLAHDDSAYRRGRFRKMADSGALDLLRQGRDAEARRLLENLL